MALDGLNHFAKAPSGSVISRSRMDRSHGFKSTFNSGDIVPIFCEEVLPGDTFDLKTSFVCRGITPVVPVMDNSFIDFYYFYIPRRLCSDTTPGENLFRKVMGENFSGFWAPSREYELETVNFEGCQPGSVASYLGMPQINIATTINRHYPQVCTDFFKAYTLVWNEFFRDQNTQAPLDIYNYGITNKTLTHSISIENGSAGNYALAGSCLKANKFHDYFTSCLPAPQKGASVLLPLGDTAPVVLSDDIPIDTSPNSTLFNNKDNLKFSFTNDTVSNGPLLRASGTSQVSSIIGGGTAVTPGTTAGIDGSNLVISSASLDGNKLYTDLSNATASTVNQLRQAFAIQKLLERDARGGSRYIELLKSHFDTEIRNDVLQRPEYLGGKRIPLTISQVLQTSSTDDIAPLGFTGAFSNTSHSDNSFIKSFKEHGIVLGVCVVRTFQSYSQGINRMFFRNKRYDFYWPELANIGEQAVLNRELFVDGSQKDDEVFGYQEAWADYRYKPSLVTGLLAPSSGDLSFRPWTYTNDFSSRPVLNSSFMEQDPSNIGNTLAVPDSPTQFIIDVFYNFKATRPMPMYSIPGLIDHH